MKLADIKKYRDYIVSMSGEQHVYHFHNGYGASVIQKPISYGYEKGLCELAVLDIAPNSSGRIGNITYSTPITNDVLGYLDLEKVYEALEQVKSLPNNPSLSKSPKHGKTHESNESLKSKETQTGKIEIILSESNGVAYTDIDIDNVSANELVVALADTLEHMSEMADIPVFELVANLTSNLVTRHS